MHEKYGIFNDRGLGLINANRLDQVASPEARRAVSAWLERHLAAEASRANLFLATSRPGGYQDAPLERARVLQVEPFSPEQSRRFIQCWYLQNEIVSSGLKETDAVRRRAQEEAEDLLRRLGENPNLYDLSVNPLLLTMLCMVHRYHGALPGSRSQLYGEISQVLLERWRQARGVTDTDGLRGEQKLSVLRPLAETYMLAGRRELEEREILPRIAQDLQAVGYTKAPLEFLRAIQSGSGLLLEKEAGVWAWAHKTFQEYLTVEYWLQRPDEARDWPRFVADEWWREAILLYAAKADASAFRGPRHGIARCLEPGLAAPCRSFPAGTGHPGQGRGAAPRSPPLPRSDPIHPGCPRPP